MLSKELEVTLNTAFKNAHDKRHEFITVEHLLLALLDNSAAEVIMKACGCDMKALHDQLTQFIDIFDSFGGAEGNSANPGLSAGFAASCFSCAGL